MSLPRELSFKSGAKYTVGQAFSNYTSTEREQLRQLLVSPDIFVSVSASFCARTTLIYTQVTRIFYPLRKVTSMLPTNGIILRWPSGKLSLTLQRGVQPQAVESVSMTISGGVMILHRTAEIFLSRSFAFIPTTRQERSFTR